MKKRRKIFFPLFSILADATISLSLFPLFSPPLPPFSFLSGDDDERAEERDRRNFFSFSFPRPFFFPSLSYLAPYRQFYAEEGM